MTVESHPCTLQEKSPPIQASGEAGSRDRCRIATGPSRGEMESNMHGAIALHVKLRKAERIAFHIGQSGKTERSAFRKISALSLRTPALASATAG